MDFWPILAIKTSKVVLVEWLEVVSETLQWPIKTVIHKSIVRESLPSKLKRELKQRKKQVLCLPL